MRLKRCSSFFGGLRADRRPGHSFGRRCDFRVNPFRKRTRTNTRVGTTARTNENKKRIEHRRREFFDRPAKAGERPRPVPNVFILRRRDVLLFFSFSRARPTHAPLIPLSPPSPAPHPPPQSKKSVGHRKGFNRWYCDDDDATPPPPQMNNLSANGECYFRFYLFLFILFIFVFFLRIYN